MHDYAAVAGRQSPIIILFTLTLLAIPVIFVSYEGHWVAL